MAKSDEQPAPKRRESKPRRPSGARNRRIVRALLFVVASLVFVDALVGNRGYIAMRRARQEYDDTTAAIASQRMENASLREEARRLREDPTAIEEIARQELGFIKPGEKVFIIKDVPAPAKP